MERPGGVDDMGGRQRCVRAGGVADAEALESWREPWVGNDPESSRSVAAGAGMQRQNAERFKYGERERRERDLHVQHLSIDQRLKKLYIKNSFDFQIQRSNHGRNA